MKAEQSFNPSIHLDLSPRRTHTHTKPGLVHGVNIEQSICTYVGGCNQEYEYVHALLHIVYAASQRRSYVYVHCVCFPKCSSTLFLLEENFPCL